MRDETQCCTSKLISGSTGAEHEATKQPYRHDRAEYDQRPHDRRHPNHRNLITKTAEGPVRFEQPGLNYVARGYRDEGGQRAHVINGYRSSDANEKEECESDVPQADPHQSLSVTPATCVPPNGSRLSCGALKKDSFLNLRAPPASSAG